MQDVGIYLLRNAISCILSLIAAAFFQKNLNFMDNRKLTRRSPCYFLIRRNRRLFLIRV